MYRFAKSAQSIYGCRGFESHPFLKSLHLVEKILIVLFFLSANYRITIFTWLIFHYKFGNLSPEESYYFLSACWSLDFNLLRNS